ncbi:hypothetical protein [Pseudomonas sp. KNUC1026]|uniref:hypothetical protein n=1 Tax=Pseudomonas sp. KNUC1026 TaxID=2893890 RepID=UPI001F3288BB|nr:hypothetical protein [Pseudomonas sp. KNUC1026]UFH51061.1 hypothetical protein LN139_08435 [Pseudomonas sp. KNUC1026]
MRLHPDQFLALGSATLMLDPQAHVPPELPLPDAPNVLRLGATTAATVLGSIGLVTALWPGDGSLPLQTYWMSVAVVTGAAGLLLALRLLMHERQRERVLMWNSCREQWLGERLHAWRQPAKVLALAYTTAAGARRLPEALRAQGPLLQPAYVEALGRTLAFSALRGYVPNACLQAYRQRLAKELATVLGRLAPSMAHLAGQPLAVRVRHGRLLPDAEIAELLAPLLAPCTQTVSLHFAHHEDGLLWLGPWLDASAPAPWLLCIDFNLFLMPAAGQAEAVSAVLLAHPSVAQSVPGRALADLHRPATGEQPADCLAQACAASRPSASGPAAAWLARLERAPTAALALAATGIAPPQQQALDTQLGHAGAAMAALLLIAACEQAKACGQAQLLLFTDRALQACVVQPCLEEALA